ncbi:MAG: carboxy terminal-processing peptidase [Planctomycetes bacterium]|nr:carboxy terminal-processing peptidase [Planctomycetota bacterium]
MRARSTLLALTVLSAFALSGWFSPSVASPQAVATDPAATSEAPSASPTLAPTSRESRITKEVVKLLDSDHLLPQTVDDKIAERAFEQFMERLDPQKLYFLRSDVEEFRRRADEIDDQVRAGDLSLAYQVFERYMQRLHERMATIDHLLESKHDFTVDEYFVIDREDEPYATTSEELDEHWRKRIKYSLLDKLAGGESAEESVLQLQKRYHNFARRMEQTDNDELLEIYLGSITNSFDPHTTYMSATTLENFQINMRLELEGIGAALQSIDGYTVVSQIIAGGAAERDGRLQPEDKIVAVAQDDDGEWEDVVDHKLSEVVKRIRGKAGTVVRLKIQRVGAEPLDIRLTRSKVELKDAEAHGEVLEHGTKPDGSPYRVGVIDLPSFYMDMSADRRRNGDFKSSTADVFRLVQQFQVEGVDGIVLDLRQNGGGALQEALNLTGIFIDQGPVVQVKDDEGHVVALDDPYPRSLAWDGPLTVLTSRFSASASEIFAGAIQDYGRGVVIGDKSTHGKGTVQTLEDVGRRVSWLGKRENYGALKITNQQFYRPNGDSTQNRGVEADVVLPSVTNHGDLGEARADYAIPFDRVPPATFQRENRVDAAIVAELNQRSQTRRSESKDWHDVDEAIARYLKYKDRRLVPLERQKFIAEWNEIQNDEKGGLVVRPVDPDKTPVIDGIDWVYTRLKPDEPEEKTEEPKANSGSGESVAEVGEDDAPKIHRDFYLDEALSITVDYIELSMAPKLAH